MCRIPHTAANLAIDPAFLNEALEVSGKRSKKEAVTLALKEFITRRKQLKILDIFGELEGSGFDINANGRADDPRRYERLVARAAQ